MRKQDVKEYFDRCAPTWDQVSIQNPEIINAILDNAEVGAGMDILDVACGTGVLIPYYLQRGAASVTAVDFAPQMAKIAAEKFAEEKRVQVLCADVEQMVFDRKFDRIVVFNALPHFPNAKHLIRVLAGLLKEDGRLTVAHGACRKKIDRQHEEGPAANISNGLLSAESLVKLFDPHFTVEIMISNRRMYQVSGVKRDPLADAHFGVTHTHGGLTHTHTHGDMAHEHTPDADAAPLQELLVLMKYLVSHNDAHAQEVADLASQLQSAGKAVAYDEIMDAVADFDMVNAKLDAILNQLTIEEC